jgi:hypothetical protein
MTWLVYAQAGLIDKPVFGAKYFDGSFIGQIEN